MGSLTPDERLPPRRPAVYPPPAVNDQLKSKSRLVARYWVASWMIPVGVVCGVGGLIQNWSRKARGWERRTPPEPVGMPDGSGLRRVGD